MPIGGSETASGVVASLETPDDFATVADFYRQALPESPWQVIEERPTAGIDSVLFVLSHNEDEGRGGTVSVVQPPDSTTTLIYVSLNNAQDAR
jgi:hypothetical protein